MEYAPKTTRHSSLDLRPARSLLVGVVSAALSLGALAPVGQAAVDPAPQDPEPTAITPNDPPVSADASTITLITGDVVHYTDDGGARPQVHVELDPDSGTRDVDIVNGPEGVFVIPDQAQPLVEADVLDRSLFDVRYLAENGYTDDEVDTLPVIVTYPEPARVPRNGGPSVLSERTAELSATAAEPLPLDSINGAGVQVDKESAEDFWNDIREAPAAPTPFSAEGDELADGVAKVWLDRRVTASLDDSRRQIGAPQAWEHGFDGARVTVAVLDSGYDADHPDLTGKVNEAVSFVPDEGVEDLDGHGTHVASTVAGTGAASGGRYAGVAPGADLVIGKVLNTGGWGRNSWVIAGMEWAAESADVVNMSLGSFPSDGTDPVSLAVNAITAETGTLFVIAAGNFGGASTVTAPATADAALAVGAVDNDDQMAGFSSRGPRAGDHALKPEIVAPGSPVVAAWAAGTDPGPGVPVGEHYLAHSGTSMASPQVAGVAAMLLQKYPDWDAAQLKDALMSTAFDTGHSVYDQGAGRVDAARATSQELFATGKADFGLLEYPVPDDAVKTRTITYTNTGASDLVLDLAIEVDGRGSPVADGAVQLSTEQLVVPAGGKADVDLTLRAARGSGGTFSGMVRATGPGGAEVITALAYAVDGPTHQLTVEVDDRFGHAPRNGTLALQDVADQDLYYRTSRLDGSGRAVFEVPPGDYALNGYLTTAEPARPDVKHSTDLFSTPVLGVTGDRTVTIDGTGAVDLEFDLVGENRPTEATQITQTVFHRPASGQHNGLTVLSDRQGGDARYGAIPTGGEASPSVYMSALTTLAEPLITATLDPPNADLFTVSPERSGQIEGSRRLQLVDVGAGRPADYEGVDVQDRIVLVQSDTAYVSDQVETAQARGAAAVLVMPTGPGAVDVVVDFDNTLPVLGTTQQEGQRIQERLEQGAVHLTLTGRQQRSFAYTVRAAEDGEIPDDLRYRVKRSDLAVIENSYHAAAARTGGSLVTAYDAWAGGATRFFEQVSQPSVRTDYVVAGPGIRQQQQATTTRGFNPVRLSSGETAYQPGKRVEVSWFKAPNHPGSHTELPCNFCRSERILWFAPSTAGDAEPSHSGSGRTSTTTRTYRDGELVSPELLLVPEPATYRIERVGQAATDDEHLLANRSETHWTFRSEAPSDLEVENCRMLLPGANACSALPVILLGYDVPLGLDNHAPANRTFHFEVRTQRAKGYTGPATVAGMKVSLSYDDGATWQQAHTKPQPDGEGFRVRAKHPKLSETNGFVTLRVEAWDEAGNSTVQTIDRAYALS